MFLRYILAIFVTAGFCMGESKAQELLGMPVPARVSPQTHVPGTSHPVTLGPGQPSQRGVPPAHDMLLALTRWTSEASELPFPNDLPRVELASKARIAAVRRQSLEGWQIPNKAIADTADDDLVSVYDSRNRTIYLESDWNSHSAADISVLVHELVHHLQNVSKETFECPQARERAAYQTQNRWLDLFDSDLSREFDADPFTLLVRSACFS